VFQLVPTNRNLPIDFMHAGVTWNYTLWLNILAVLATAAMFILNQRRRPLSQRN
jgi:hypothetical protein